MFQSMWYCWLLVGSVVLPSQADLQESANPRAESQPAAGLVATTKPTSPAESVTTRLVRLSSTVYPDGVSDEQAYARHNRERAAALLAAADQADDPLQGARHRLAAANWMLARQAEPQISRLLLGIELPGDLTSLRSLVAQAQSQLETARSLLDGAADDTDPTAALPQEEEGAESEAQTVDKLRGVRTDLSAFADALAIAWSSADGEDFAERARRSASALGVLLEDDRPGVATAAMVYQAVLYGRSGQPARALAVLDLVLKPPPRDEESAAFFARLLRCRHLARQGGYAVAWSLLLRLEERARAWFESPEQSEEAFRAAALLRLEVAGAWQEALARADKVNEAAWCEWAAQEIHEAFREGAEHPSVLRLGSAIPLLIDNHHFRVNQPEDQPG